ncbi:unnamed protein product [Prorocentrum cordatum]|uniref:Uncharacterized protein n=1 Tax=Prorocentrum cordatum TaxID=2364126 RepID=A0ABN9RC79_9DINO|nr:unnamed protein product [Polarella glacialis]
MVDPDLIDVQKLCQNAQFKLMIEKGWAWEVAPSIIDELFPGFAHVAQKALNTQNHIGTEVGELETCMTLAASANDPGMRELAGWKDMAVENVVSLNVPSAKYSKTLLDFVESFGVFASETNLRPLIRVAVAIANLTGDKVEDGAARLLVENDVAKLASKPRMAEADTAERILDETMGIAEGLGGIDAALEPLGQLFVRVALKPVGKEKMVRKGKEYKWDDICNAFLRSLSCLKGQTVTFDEWAKHAVSSVATSAAAKPTAASAATLDDQKDPTWIAKRAGYSVGLFVVQKAIAPSAQRVYTIFSIGQTVNLHEAVNRDADREPHTAEITLADPLEQRVVSKVEPPRQIDGDQQRPQQLYIDKQKAALYRAFLELDAKHVGKHKLAFWRKLDEVRTTSAIKQYHDTTLELFVLPVARPRDNGATKCHEAAFVAAHWWVGTTFDNKQANMASSHVPHGGFTLPVLTNAVDIGPNVKLQMFVKPKAKAVPIHEQSASAKKQKKS